MGEVFCVWGGKDFLQSAASRLICGWGAFREVIPYTSAEIPPAGAPSGFDGTP